MEQKKERKLSFIYKFKYLLHSKIVSTKTKPIDK